MKSASFDEGSLRLKICRIEIIFDINNETMHCLLNPYGVMFL